MPSTQDIVAKLWNLCHVLRDDGITYHEYVTELTYLLFLKMMKETEQEQTGKTVQIPRGYRWDDLIKVDGIEQLTFYKKLLVDLGSNGSKRTQAIFNNASTALRQPRHLRTVVDSIDALDWYSAKSEGLGNLYEGLLEKNAEETKSGAGQYFTPRPLIDSMIALVKPQPGELIQDPALGTGGFLINADRYMREQVDHYKLSSAQQDFQRKEASRPVRVLRSSMHRSFRDQSAYVCDARDRTDTMYLPWFPCPDCARAVVQTGIATLVAVPPGTFRPEVG